MGDATKKSESIMIKNLENREKYIVDNFNNKYVGLKVGHHGSKTSTSEELLKKFKFSFAIISARKEEFGHPAKETIDILNKYMIKQYITEKVGTIKYLLN